MWYANLKLQTEEGGFILTAEEIEVAKVRIYDEFLIHVEITEYELMQRVKIDTLHQFSEDPILGLFQKHFLVRHCLYSLNPDFLKMGKVLDISPIKIRLTSLEPANGISEVSASAFHKLSEYYLDWNHYRYATPENVGELMAQFWKQFHAEDDREAAFTCLELPVTAVWSEIKLAYQNKIAAAHPDKGGDSERFREIRLAYETLKISEKGSS